MQESNKSNLLGIIWMLIHCLILSVIILIVKFLALAGYSPMQLVFFQSFIAFITLLPFAFYNEGKNLLKIELPYLYIIKSFLWFLSLFLYFLGVKFVPLNDSRAIALFYPVITFTFAVIFLKEELDIMKIICLIVSLIGGYIIINPHGVSFQIELLYILLAVTFWSIIDLIIKKMSKSQSTLKQLFFLTGLMSLFSFPFAIYSWQNPQNLIHVSLLTLIGILFLLNIISLFLAIKYADLTIIMPFDFSGMIFTVILAYFAFTEVIKANIFIGSLIVFISTVYLIFSQSRKVRKVTANNYYTE